ncbi:MAG: transcription antitermination factor NusB [Mycobacteriales bacterium]
MSARTKARKRALDVLFEAEQRARPVLEVLAERRAQGEPPVPPYAGELVEGVVAHQEHIDALLAERAQGWALDRMPAVDRNLLRVATYELLWCPQVPDAVVIAEAVHLAGELSTEESPGFVNGLLASLAAGGQLAGGQLAGGQLAGGQLADSIDRRASAETTPSRTSRSVKDSGEVS